MIDEVLVIGGGMITHDQILPSLWQLQRLGVVGKITVCATKASTIRSLRSAADLQRAFPGQRFYGYPESNGEDDPNAYKKLLDEMPPGNLVIVATPDHLHYRMTMRALESEQHVCCVKPLVQSVKDSIAIENESRVRGLFVGVEYHKRFDDRSLMARRRYREGRFGHFRLGTAWLMEKWYYRHSNFQNWCTSEHSDAFTYIGCHYVDLVHFITGLLPSAISVYGLTDRYPNGKEGYLWTDARVIWNNGACLNVQNSLSFPDAAPGSNTQGMRLHCSGHDRGAFLDHSDQFRGLQYCYVESGKGAGDTAYAEPSPDYMQYVETGDKGLMPVGYGYRSIEAIVRGVVRVKGAGDTDARRAEMRLIDEEGILATPANSRYNELVTEAARLSILNYAREAVIYYGDEPHVVLR